MQLPTLLHVAVAVALTVAQKAVLYTAETYIDAVHLNMHALPFERNDAAEMSGPDHANSSTQSVVFAVQLKSSCCWQS